MTFENTFAIENENEFYVEVFKCGVDNDAHQDAVCVYDLKIEEKIDTFKIVGKFTNLSEFVIDYQLSDYLEPHGF